METHHNLKTDATASKLKNIIWVMPYLSVMGMIWGYLTAAVAGLIIGLIVAVVTSVIIGSVPGIFSGRSQSGAAHNCKNLEVTNPAKS